MSSPCSPKTCIAIVLNQASTISSGFSPVYPASINSSINSLFQSSSRNPFFISSGIYLCIKYTNPRLTFFSCFFFFFSCISLLCSSVVFTVFLFWVVFQLLSLIYSNPLPTCLSNFIFVNRLSLLYQVFVFIIFFFFKFPRHFSE